MGYAPDVPIDQLNPGAEVRVPFYFEVQGFGISLHLAVVDQASTQPFPWATFEALLKPSPAPADWDQRWASATTAIGHTWREVLATTNGLYGFQAVSPDPPLFDHLILYQLGTYLAQAPAFVASGQEAGAPRNPEAPSLTQTSRTYRCPGAPSSLPSFQYDAESDVVLHGFNPQQIQADTQLLFAVHGNVNSASDMEALAQQARDKDRAQPLQAIVPDWDVGAHLGGVLPWTKSLCFTLARDAHGRWHWENVLESVGRVIGEQVERELAGVGKTIDCSRVTFMAHSFGNPVSYHAAHYLCPNAPGLRLLAIDPASLLSGHGITDYGKVFNEQMSFVIRTNSLYDEHSRHGLREVCIANVTNPFADVVNTLNHGAGRAAVEAAISRCFDPIVPTRIEQFEREACETPKVIMTPGPFPIPVLPAGFTITIPSITSFDPNDKLVSDTTIPPGEYVRFTIRFENVMTATAPAQDVYIVDRFDPQFDWHSVIPLEAQFGLYVMPLAAHGPSQSVAESVVIADYRPAITTTWEVRLQYQMNTATGFQSWHLGLIDPATGLPPEDPLAGFLPPNDANGRGEGQVTFLVAVRPDAAWGSTLTNEATIVFDVNEPIQTPVVTLVVVAPYHTYLPVIRR
jgi:hypothetical protein